MHTSSNVPVIVLIENSTSSDAQFVRQWLLESRYESCEASDVFAALEEISDFTMQSRPDVILLDAGSTVGELSFIREMVKSAPGEPEASIISMSAIAISTDESDFYAGDLSQVAARLESLIPDRRIPAN